MEKGLPASIKERLDTALNDWKTWDAPLGSCPEVKKVLNGKTNDTFLLSEPGTDFRLVIRLNNKRPEALGIDRNREASILQTIASENICPKVYYQDANILVSEYIQGQPLSIKNLNAGILEDTAKALRTLHELDCNLASRISLVDEMKNYALQTNTLPISSLIGNLHDEMIELVYETDRQVNNHFPQAHSLCHHDLLSDNLIATSSGIKILDWEYANIGNPVYDLSVFFEALHIDIARKNAFLKAYGLMIPDIILTRYGAAYRYLELLWWLVRDGEVTNHSLRRLERLQVATKGLSSF